MTHPLASSHDPRGEARRRCDVLAGDLAAAADPGHARLIIDALHALAGAIHDAVADWGRLCAPLPMGVGFDEARARAIVLETVFDELLAPEAWRLLSAALRLAGEPRP